jgi:hypothetical protein
LTIESITCFLPAICFTWRLRQNILLNLYITTWHYMPEDNNLWVPQKASHLSNYQLSKTVFHGWLMSSHFCFCHYCFQYFTTTVNWTKHQILFIVHAETCRVMSTHGNAFIGSLQLLNLSEFPNVGRPFLSRITNYWWSVV